MQIALLKKFALAGAVVSVTLLAAGCASRYDNDGYYSDDGYRHRDYDHGTRWRDRHDSDTKRVRVCDEDGDDCHWEYRNR